MQLGKRQRSTFTLLDSSMAAAEQQQHRPSGHCTSRFTTCRQWIFAVMACVFALTPLSEAFSISMEYRPPVKSSVSKMHDRRMAPRPFSSESSPSASSQSRPSSRKDAYAGVYAPESPSSPSPSSFERRMRELALGTQSKTIRKKPTTIAQRPTNVHVVESLQDYKRIVGEEKSKVVAVRFHASWCRACKAVAPLFYRLAAMHKDIVFVDVPVTQDNAVIHQGLGVPSLPFGHIYHPRAGLVEELKLTRKEIQDFESALIKTKADLKALSM